LTRRLLDEARDAVAAAAAASSKEVFFTSGATEGNRLVVDMLLVQAEKKARPLVVVTTPLEHPSLQKPLLRAAARGTIELRLFDVVDERVVVDAGRVKGADAVVVTAAHNETGLVIDLAAVAAVVDEGCIVVVDASQSLGRIGAPPARVDAIADWRAAAFAISPEFRS
jgi:cysteine desulfurase